MSLERIEKANINGKFVYGFSILHSAWEHDYKGWILEENGKKKLVLTNHEIPYVAKRQELLDLMDKYQQAMNETRQALRVLGEDSE